MAISQKPIGLSLEVPDEFRVQPTSRMYYAAHERLLGGIKKYFTGMKYILQEEHARRFLSVLAAVLSLALSPGEKRVLASGRRVPVVRVALLATQRRPALGVSLVRGRDVNVAFAQPLAGAQPGAGVAQQARALLRGRKEKWLTQPENTSHGVS